MSSCAGTGEGQGLSSMCSSVALGLSSLSSGYWGPLGSQAAGACGFLLRLLGKVMKDWDIIFLLYVIPGLMFD